MSVLKNYKLSLFESEKWSTFRNEWKIKCSNGENFVQTNGKFIPMGENFEITKRK